MSASARRSPEVQIIEEKIVKVNGDIAIKRYQKGRFLGKGGFAKCFELICLDTQLIFACKVIPKATLSKSRARQKLMSEIKIHRGLRHENIVQFETFFEDNENVYILLELCQNQSMNELLRRRKRLTELEVKYYLAQLINGVKYLHGHRIIHRDLKLGNMFLNDKLQIKLGDFGLATKLEFEGERKRTICGTPNYIAPEVLDGRQGHSYEVDTWSIGVIAYTLMVGKPPFETSDVKATYKKIRMNDYTFPDHSCVSREGKAFVARILHSIPTSRPTLDELFEHPFFQISIIPRQLPQSTVAVPPSNSYIKQFQKGQGNFTEREGRAEGSSTTRPMRSSSQPQFKNLQLSQSESNSQVTQQLPQSPALSEESKSRKVSSASQYTPVQGGPDIWVRRWLDYSNKYGLGYLLSSNVIGIFFNDSSKIMSNRERDTVCYVPKTSQDDLCQVFPIEQFPKELGKKLTLLNHFGNHLTADAKANAAMNQQTIYVKKWIRTAHAIIFRLSNKTVQVIFGDRTELFICSDSKIITYVDKGGVVSTFPISQALQGGNLEMAKRLKYTKDVLSKIGQPRPDTGNKQPIQNIIMFLFTVPTIFSTNSCSKMAESQQSAFQIIKSGGISQAIFFIILISLFLGISSNSNAFIQVYQELNNNKPHAYRWPQLEDFYYSLYVAIALVILRYTLYYLFMSAASSIIAAKYEKEERRIRAQRLIEQSIKASFYAISFIYGYTVIKDDEWLPWTLGGNGESIKMIKGWPYQVFQNPSGLDYYILTELGFHTHILVTHWFEPIKKNFIEMLLHHCVTIFLIVASYLLNYHGPAALILFSHDLADIFVSSTRAFFDTKYTNMTVLNYAILMITWTATRIIWYPIEMVYPILSLLILSPGQYIVGQTVLQGGVLLLQVLHVFWFFKLADMGLGYLIKKEYKDTIDGVNRSKDDQ